MQEQAYDAPQNCPPEVKAADGKTTLMRYRVEAVIYAPSRRAAVARLEQANIYLDAARVVGVR
jgi:ribosomal protein L2